MVAVTISLAMGNSNRASCAAAAAADDDTAIGSVVSFVSLVTANNTVITSTATHFLMFLLFARLPEHSVCLWK